MADYLPALPGKNYRWRIGDGELKVPTVFLELWNTGSVRWTTVGKGKISPGNLDERTILVTATGVLERYEAWLANLRASKEQREKFYGVYDG